MEKGDIKKTIILTAFIIISILFIWSLDKELNKKYDINAKQVIDKDSEIVTTLVNRLNSNNILRKPLVNENTLDNETILKYILLNIDLDSMKQMSVKPIKILCTVNSKITFTSSKTCNVFIIPNELFIEKEREYFNLDRELEFPEINYYGYKCKNDSKYYYCLKNNYIDYTRGFSYVDKVYSDNDDIIIREYYLMVNITDSASCINYFDESYCQNYSTESLPELSDEKILEYGTLYEHVFSKYEDNYYLKSSRIITE